MIPRDAHIRAVEERLQRNPVVGLLGARQVGKTTLAREIARTSRTPVHLLDLENPRDVALLDDPLLALEDREGLVILDEIQRRPELFPVLRVLADRPEAGCRFLVLGSASPELLRQTSESLAGRISYYLLPGLSAAEVGEERLQDLWIRGGFPRSFLADTGEHSLDWRRDFIGTFLERDLPQLGVTIPAATLRRFWSMLAHLNGQLLNASELGRALGVRHSTVRRYLDLLTGAFVVTELPPWHENLKKRQVKAPKLYISDSGLLHTLLDIETEEDLLRHPGVGASWEGFALREVMTRLRLRPDQCYFWRTHTGAELDLLVISGRERRGFEIKRASAPTLTKSMRIAMDDLRLSSLDVIYPGTEAYPLAEGVRALPITGLSKEA